MSVTPDAPLARSERLDEADRADAPDDAPEGASGALSASPVDTLGDVRTLLGNPDLSPEQRQRAIAIEAEVLDRQRLASVEAQAATRHAEAAEARARAAEKVRVHPATHPGPCPPPGGAWVSRAQLEALASRGTWHLDVDQVRPSWWPDPVVTPVTRS